MENFYTDFLMAIRNENKKSKCVFVNKEIYYGDFFHAQMFGAGALSYLNGQIKFYLYNNEAQIKEIFALDKMQIEKICYHTDLLSFGGGGKLIIKCKNKAKYVFLALDENKIGCKEIATEFKNLK